MLYLLAQKTAGFYNLVFDRVFGDAQPEGYFLVGQAFYPAEAEDELTLWGQHVQHPAFYPLKVCGIHGVFGGIGGKGLVMEYRLTEICIQRSFLQNIENTVPDGRMQIGPDRKGRVELLPVDPYFHEYLLYCLFGHFGRAA